MARPSQLLIAHDLPMSLAEAADEMGKLGEGWYLPRDPYAQIDELLAEGQLSIEREGPEQIYAYLHQNGGQTVIQGQGETVTAALLEVYGKVRDGT